VATDAREHSGESRAGCPRRRGSVRRGLERGDELAAPEDPLISYLRRPRGLGAGSCCGLVAVLEEVSDAVVPPIERPGVPGEEGAHAAGERTRARAHQEMRVVREEGPGIDGPRALLRHGGDARDEVGAICVVAEDDAPLESPHHHMVENPGGIQARLAGDSERSLSQYLFRSNVYDDDHVRVAGVEAGNLRDIAFPLAPLRRDPGQVGPRAEQLLRPARGLASGLALHLHVVRCGPDIRFAFRLSPHGEVRGLFDEEAGQVYAKPARHVNRHVESRGAALRVVYDDE